MGHFVEKNLLKMYAAVAMPSSFSATLFTLFT
jgi:hypothetical protein